MDFSGPHGPIRTHMGPYGPVWAHLGPARALESAAVKHVFSGHRFSVNTKSTKLRYSKKNLEVLKIKLEVLKKKT